MDGETEIYLDEAGQVAAEAELATAAAGLLAQLPDWVFALDRTRWQQIEQARAAGDHERAALFERHDSVIEEDGLLCHACLSDHHDYLDSLDDIDDAELYDLRDLLYPCAVLRNAGWPDTETEIRQEG